MAPPPRPTPPPRPGPPPTPGPPPEPAPKGTQAPPEHVVPAPQQLVPHVVVPAPHIAVHAEFEQNGVAAGHTLPHVPQLAGSLLTVEQVLPHIVVPVPQRALPPPAPTTFPLGPGRHAELRASAVDKPRIHPKRRFMRQAVFMLLAGCASKTSPRRADFVEAWPRRVEYRQRRCRPFGWPRAGRAYLLKWNVGRVPLPWDTSCQPAFRG
jgi:hypothetical protein